MTRRRKIYSKIASSGRNQEKTLKSRPQDNNHFNSFSDATGEPVFYLDGRFVRRESTGLLSNDCSPVQNLTQSGECVCG